MRGKAILTKSSITEPINWPRDCCRSGLHKGDKVAIYAWNRSEIVETEVACFKAGFVRISMNARLSTTEAVHVLNNAEARVVIVDAFHVKSIIEKQKRASESSAYYRP